MRLSGVCTAFIFERITWCPDGELAEVILFHPMKTLHDVVVDAACFFCLQSW